MFTTASWCSATLEGLAGRLACEHATDAEIHEVRQLHDRMMDMYAKRDRLPYFKLNQNIHSAILRLSKNEALADVHSILQARLRRIRYIGNEGPEKWAGAVADHEEMIAALEARDAERLSKVLTAHMEKTWERVKTRHLTCSHLHHRSRADSLRHSESARHER